MALLCPRVSLVPGLQGGPQWMGRFPVGGWCSQDSGRVWALGFEGAALDGLV